MSDSRLARQEDQERYLVLEIGAWLFQALNWVSVSWLLERFLEWRVPNLRGEYRWRYKLVDVWVLANLALSFLFLIVATSPPISSLATVILFYAGYRMLEIAIRQINTIIFDWYRAEQHGRESNKDEYAVGRYARLVLLALCNYAEGVFWFALVYYSCRTLFIDPKELLASWWGSLYYSVANMTLMGSSEILPSQSCAFMLLTLNSLFAIFLALVVLARFMGMLRQPAERD